MPYFCVPRYLEVLDEIPKNVIGRVRKDVLRSRGLGAGAWDREAHGYVAEPRRTGDKQMTMTYQQQFVLDGLAGRAAILDLDARHNRLYSAGDLAGWIATFRHAGATYTRAGETFTDLRAAFDGGNGQRLVTVDHEISRRRRRSDPALRRTAVPRQRLRATGTYHRQPHLRARRLVLHVARTRVGPRAAGERAAGVSADISYEFAFGTYEDALGWWARAPSRGSRAPR